MKNIRKELINMKLRVGMLQAVDCSPEENEEYESMQQAGKSLPENIHANKAHPGCFFTLVDHNLSEKETNEYLLIKQYEEGKKQNEQLLVYVKKIRFWITLYGTLSVIAAIIALLVGIVIGLS